MKKALFLDRDGIINEDVSYAHRPEQIRFCEGVFELCRAAVDKGYRIIVVTNQAGVAKGHFSEEAVGKLHEWIAEQFFTEGITITAFYYCPYHKDGTVEKYRKESNCRKPEPGMFLKAAEDYQLDIAMSLMVGDKPSDRILLENLKSVIVRSRYTGDDYDVETIKDVIPLL
jgi:D-glycero-D-manno-heptose 1,7-bisphosphate phosphatase